MEKQWYHYIIRQGRSKPTILILDRPEMWLRITAYIGPYWTIGEARRILKLWR